MAHNRWFDVDTVYANDPPVTPAKGYNGKTFDFIFGNDIGLPAEQEFWDYLFDINVSCFELCAG